MTLGMRTGGRVVGPSTYLSEMVENRLRQEKAACCISKNRCVRQLVKLFGKSVAMFYSRLPNSDLYFEIATIVRPHHFICIADRVVT